MSVKNNYNYTIVACCIAYITQAIAVNFPPLLFLTFQNDYGVSIGQLGSLVAITFIIQIAVDFFATKYIDKIGYRPCVIFAHVMAGVGFILLGILPEILPNPMLGIWIACFFYSFSSGLLEVLVSPIVESCPTDNKESVMALLHSFYCWGTAAVILISIVFFSVFGIQNWRIMAMMWAALPLINMIFFYFVPIAPMEGEGENSGILPLLKHKFIWVVILMMLASGAAELSMSQWASAFAESGLGVSKTVGDIAGPFMFAILMGMGRVVYAALVKRIPLLKYMLVCAFICIAAYIMTALSSNPVLSLIGCGLVGFSVGAFWPGTISYAAGKMPQGGTAMFALFAFSGDIGCSTGPAVVAYVSEAFGNNLNIGLISVIVFPVLLMCISAVMMKRDGK